MSTYKQILYQIVFATKNRERTINPKYCEELYKYIWGVIKDKNCKLYRINGIEDHLHIVCDLHPKIALADYIKDIKVSSSKWAKESGKFESFKGWGDGYGAFTYSIKEKDRLIEYVRNQKSHHKKFDFITEYKELLAEHEIEFDPRYLP